MVDHHRPGGRQAGSNSISPAAPIKLVMLNKLGGNEGAYLFFNNLGSVVFLPFSILPGRNFWPPLLSIRSSQTTSSQKGNEPFLSEELHSVRYFQIGKNSAIRNVCSRSWKKREKLAKINHMGNWKRFLEFPTHSSEIRGLRST